MPEKIPVTADNAALLKEVASLLCSESRRERYLDQACGEIHINSCILHATLGNDCSAAVTALAKASPTSATLLMRFIYGEEVELKDENELLQLFMLARNLGATACANACRPGIGNPDQDFPFIIKVNEEDATQQRDRLRAFYSEGRFVDITIRAKKVATDGSDEPNAVVADSAAEAESNAAVVDFRLHRVVLAAASEYFAARWTHGFADGCSASSAIEVDIDPDLFRQFVKIIYGEKVELSIEELVQLYVFADKWQVPGVSTPALAQIEEHLAPELALDLLKSSTTYPNSVVHAALVKFADLGVTCGSSLKAGMSVRALQDLACQCFDKYFGRRYRTLRVNARGKVILVSPEFITINFESLGTYELSINECKHLSLENAFDDVVSNKPGLLVHVLTDQIDGVPGDIKKRIVCASSSKSIGRMIASSEWLGLSVDMVVQAYAFMCRNADNDQQKVLIDGIVQWAKAGDATAGHDALLRLRSLCHARAQVQDQFPDGTSGTLLFDLSRQLLKAYGESAFPVAWKILTEQASHPDHAKTSDTDDSKEASTESPLGRKRSRESADDHAVLQAVVEWARPRLKRICTSKSWPSARPAAMVALLQKAEEESEGEDEIADTEEMKSAVNAWASSASLQYVLEALGCLGTYANPALFQTLLGSASAKALTLEQHNASLSGGGLRDALEAQRKADARASEAEAMAAKQAQACDEMKATIASMIAEPCPLRAQIRSLIGEPSASDLESRKATAGA